VTAALAVPTAAVAQGGNPASAPVAKAGGGKFTPSLPADFPADVPLPPGTLTGSTANAPTWVVALLMRGGYPEVMASVHDFYISRGYSEAGPTWMYHLSNGIHSIQFAGQNHDHSATQTDVSIGVTRL